MTFVRIDPRYATLHCTRHAPCSTWRPCLLDGDWCLRSDVVTNSCLQALMYRQKPGVMPEKERTKFDVIDLDPYGSAAPFLDAVQGLRHHFDPDFFARFRQRGHHSAVSRGLHHAARCHVLIGVRLAVLCFVQTGASGRPDHRERRPPLRDMHRYGGARREPRRGAATSTLFWDHFSRVPRPCLPLAVYPSRAYRASLLRG